MESLEIAQRTAQREWTVDGIPVLTAELNLPQPVGEGRGLRRLCRYYEQFGRSYLRYCERFLFPQAAEAYRDALSASAPLPACTASLTHRITWNGDGVLSLFTDSCESCGTRPLRVRRGDTWDLNTFLPVSLADCFPPRCNYRKRVQDHAAGCIETQLAAQTSVYREDWRRALRRGFNRENFYLSSEGLCIFYQMFVLAPPMEGIPVFCLPYGEDGPFSHPRRG